MRNAIEPSIQQRIIEKPEFLSKSKIVRSSTLRYAKIAETLNILDAKKCMTWDRDEFFKEFGKNALMSMRQQLKKYKVVNPKVVIDDETHTVYVFRIEE